MGWGGGVGAKDPGPVTPPWTQQHCTQTGSLVQSRFTANIMGDYHGSMCTGDIMGCMPEHLKWGKMGKGAGGKEGGG